MHTTCRFKAIVNQNQGKEYQFDWDRNVVYLINSFLSFGVSVQVLLITENIYHCFLSMTLSLIFSADTIFNAFLF